MTDLLAARERLEAECALVKGTTFLRRKAYVLAEDVEELLTEFDRRGVALQQAERERPLRDKTRIVRQGQNQYLYDQWDIRIVHCGDLTAHGYHGFVAGGSDLRCPGTSERIAEAFVAERDAAVARAEKAERHLDYATAAMLAEEINEVPPKPCATFVSREPPGTMGASCVHCGFPAAHHRIEPTDYAELMEYGELARAAEARCVQYEQALRELIGACAPPVEALASVHSDGKWIDPSVVAALVGARDELRRCVVLLAAGSGLGGEATAARPQGASVARRTGAASAFVGFTGAGGDAVSWRTQVVEPSEMSDADIRAELRHDLAVYERLQHPMSRAGMAHRIEVLVAEMDKRCGVVPLVPPQ